MYRCLDCKFEFLNPVRYIERHSEDYREEWYGCPRCAGAYEELEGSDLFAEFAQFEIDKMCERYDDECGECITRKATEVEMRRIGRTEPTETETYLDKPHGWWKDTEDKMYGRR